MKSRNRRGDEPPPRGHDGGSKALASLMATCVFLVAMATRPAEADPTFRVTSLGGATGLYIGQGVNDAGQVAGAYSTADGSSHAAATGSDGVGLTDLGGSNASGQAINASGQVAGYATSAGGSTHAFLGTAGGGMVDLGTLAGGTSSLGFAVNAAGQVAGTSTVSIGGVVQSHAFVTGANGAGMIDLGTLGGSVSNGYAINASGQVTGASSLVGSSGTLHAFLTVGGTMKDLGTLAGGTTSVGQAVNDAGQVAGASYGPAGSYRAFLTDASGGTMHDLGALAPGGDSYAYGLNNRGQVVGYASIAPGRFDAFVTNDGVMYDLNDLVDNSLKFHLSVALAITDSGRILALGTDASGRTKSYLLDLTGALPNSAVPEPSSLAALGVGLAVLAARSARRRRRERVAVGDGDDPSPTGVGGRS